jgi:hypothetical protein
MSAMGGSPAAPSDPAAGALISPGGDAGSADAGSVSECVDTGRFPLAIFVPQ